MYISFMMTFLHQLICRFHVISTKIPASDFIHWQIVLNIYGNTKELAYPTKFAKYKQNWKIYLPDSNFLLNYSNNAQILGA